MTDLDIFFNAYVDCALWSSMDESDECGGEPMDANYLPNDIHPETQQEMRNDCEKFLQENAEDIEKYPGPGNLLDHAGHDFWLTRNWHGAGFWDGDWEPEEDPELGDRLTKASEWFGNYHLYVGDDGWIYGM
jgi:hypothetical protein